MPFENVPVILIPGRAHPHGLARLEAQFEVHHIEDPDASLSADLAARVTAIATFMYPIDSAFIDRFGKLELISSFGVGYDHVDAAYAASKGVLVAHTPSVLDDEVADTTLGLLLNTVRELPRAETWLRDGNWVAKGAYRLTPLTLRDRTVGIFGLGRIGQAIARRLEPFGVAIHYHNRRQVDGMSYPYHPTLFALAGAVDTLINVAPATAQTKNAVNADVLAALGPSGVFINVGRGATVDEAALADALHSGTIAAAGLDVFADEPHVPQALLDAPNTVLLPHVASASVHTRNAMADLVVDNVVAWSAGKRPLTPTPESLTLLD